MFKLAPSLALAALASSTLSSAFEVSFPASGDKGYWVACQNNTLSWTSNSSDPAIFSVALLNANQKDLNGNYQIANSLKTADGSATIWPNCVAPGQYTVLFVNASNYALNNPEVYYTTPSFEIKPNGTAKAAGAPDAGAGGSSSSSSSSSGSGSGSSSSTSSGNASSSSDASASFASGPGNSSANASQGNGAVGLSGASVPLVGVATGLALGAATLLGLAL